MLKTYLVIIIFSKFFKRLNLVGKLGMKCGGQQSLNKEIDIYIEFRDLFIKRRSLKFVYLPLSVLYL